MMRKEDETRRRRRIGKRRRERESITGVGGNTPVPDLPGNPILSLVRIGGYVPALRSWLEDQSVEVPDA